MKVHKSGENNNNILPYWSIFLAKVASKKYIAPTLMNTIIHSEAQGPTATLCEPKSRINPSHTWK